MKHARIVQLLNSLCVSFAAVGAMAFTHVSPSAETLRPGKMAFQPYPGSNPIQDYAFLTNSLSIGIWNGFEAGTVPLMWNSSDSFTSKNFNLKIRLWRSQQWTVGFGSQYRMYDAKGAMRESFESLTINQIAFSIENRPLGSNFQFRYNVATSQMLIYGMPQNTYFKMDPWIIPGGIDHYLDSSYAASDTNTWILGLSHNHEWLSGLGTKDAAGFGAGLSHAWKIKNAFLSGFSLGFHVRERTGANTLASVLF